MRHNTLEKQIEPSPTASPVHKPVLDPTAEVDEAVNILKEHLLPHITKNPNKSGKRYSTCIFTVTRNEHHLTEFLVRNLLAGVQHVWLMDDNRSQFGRDMDLNRLVAPFVKLGLVDVIAINHTADVAITESEKVSYIERAFQIGKPLCDWGSVTDSDEVWYPLDPKYAFQLSLVHRGMKSIEEWRKEQQGNEEGDASGIAQLGPLLERLDAAHMKANHAISSYRWGWSETDNEGRVLRANAPLLETYPRLCYSNWHVKAWSRMDRLHNFGDHGASAIDKRAKPIDFRNSEHMFMIHYQMKSVEEYLVKIDQAFVDWRRSLRIAHRKCNTKYRQSYYNLKKAVGSPLPIPYAKRYSRIVNTILRLWPIDPDSAYLTRIQTLTKPFNSTPHWDLYMFFKWAVASRYEWNEQLYRERNPSVVISERTFDDGLHHFLATGFYNGSTACFTTPSGHSFCTEKR